MSKAKKKDTRTIVHIIDAQPGVEYRTARDSRETLLLCGAKLWRRERDDNGSFWKAVATAPNDMPLRDRVRPRDKYQRVCQACRVLQAMTPEKRVEALLARALKAQDTKIDRQDARAVELQQLDAEIARGEVDALVCLDAWESGLASEIDRVTRCGAWIGQDDPTFKLRCNLQQGHRYGANQIPKCRAPLDGEPPHLHMPDVLALAIKAQKRAANIFDRGDRLYVMRERFQCLRCDRWEGYKPLKAAEVGITSKTERRLFCPTCFGGVDSIKPFSQSVVTKCHEQSIRDIVCRFCSLVIMHDRKMGLNFSNVADVKNHCVPCALRFLGKVALTTDQHLPEQSFVLAMDDDDSCEAQP